MNKHLLSGIAATTFAASLAFTAPASAAVTFDPATGTGFVGKGDVQTAVGVNDALLQRHAGTVDFRVASVSVSETTWVCTNEKNEKLQQRAETTTASVTGLVTTVARANKNNSVNGFNLTGYEGTPLTSAVSEGDPVDSCPSGPWSLTSPAGDPVLLSANTTTEVYFNGSWYEL